MKKYGDIYQRWGLSATPFAVEALKSNAKGERLLRGRDNEIESVVRRLHREGRITCIDGHIGSGKTSLANVATYKCIETFKNGETSQILVPCSTSFQLKEDLDIDQFTRHVLYHVIATIKDHQVILKPLCDFTGFDNFGEIIGSPILKFESPDITNSISIGVPGVASWTSSGKGAVSVSANNTEAFLSAGFEQHTRDLLARLFTSVSGGVVCVIDNIELLETANKARRTLELLRDRLLTVKGLRWVFCGANGVIHSLASSPRLSAFLNTPVLDLKNVQTKDLKSLIDARIEEYSTNPSKTIEDLPFGIEEIEWLYEILNRNLRDLLSQLEQYCEYIHSQNLRVDPPFRDSLMRAWVKRFGEIHYNDISKRISKNAWVILDTAMGDEFKGSFGVGDRDKISRNSKVVVTDDTFIKWLRDLKKHDILTKSISDDSSEASSEGELDIYTVTSKGALVFYFRQRAQQNHSLATYEWLRRVNN